MARPYRLNIFRVFAVDKLVQREERVRFLYVARGPRHDDDLLCKSLLRHDFERDAVGNVAVQELHAVELHDMAQQCRRRRCANFFHVFVLVEIAGQQVGGFPRFQVRSGSVEIGLRRILAELLEIERIDLARDFIVAVLHLEKIAGTDEVPETHVALVRRMDGIETLVPFALFRKIVAKVRRTGRSPCITAELEAVILHHVEHARQVGTAHSAAFKHQRRVPVHRHQAFSMSHWKSSGWSTNFSGCILCFAKNSSRVIHWKASTSPGCGTSERASSSESCTLYTS